jgi:hypothetical protein
MNGSQTWASLRVAGRLGGARCRSTIIPSRREPAAALHRLRCRRPSSTGRHVLDVDRIARRAACVHDARSAARIPLIDNWSRGEAPNRELLRREWVRSRALRCGLPTRARGSRPMSRWFSGSSSSRRPGPGPVPDRTAGRPGLSVHAHGLGSRPSRPPPPHPCSSVARWGERRVLIDGSPVRFIRSLAHADSADHAWVITGRMRVR